MKKFLLSLMALGCMTMAQGQNDMWTATLQHGDQVTVFKTMNALIEAYNAAVDGDVITLSEGTFNSVTISKSITIYGAGFEDCDSTATRVTKISGTLNIGQSGVNLNKVHIEGCYLGGVSVGVNGSSETLVTSLCIKRCLFTGITFNNSPMQDFLLTENVIMGDVVGNSQFTVESGQINNCYVQKRIMYFNNCLDKISVDHCIIYGGAHTNVFYTNDIFAYNDIYQFSTGINMQNCVLGGHSYYLTNATDCFFDVGVENIFTDGTNGVYSAERTFEIRQPDVWIGTDGTQIGIHGGTGWNKMPSIPSIKNLELNIEGPQLNVTFEAVAR